MLNLYFPSPISLPQFWRQMHNNISDAIIMHLLLELRQTVPVAVVVTQLVPKLHVRLSS